MYIMIVLASLTFTNKKEESKTKLKMSQCIPELIINARKIKITTTKHCIKKNFQKLCFKKRKK